MSKVTTKKGTAAQLVTSLIVVIASLWFLVYWGMGMPEMIGETVFRGDPSSLYALPYVLPVVAGGFIAWYIIPRRHRKVDNDPKRWLVRVFGACIITFVTLFMPFPADYPGCCMVGPTRERGLPVAYATATADFGKDDEFPPASYNFALAAINVVAWALLIVYMEVQAEAIRTLQKGGRKR